MCHQHTCYVTYSFLLFGLDQNKLKYTGKVCYVVLFTKYVGMYVILSQYTNIRYMYYILHRTGLCLSRVSVFFRELVTLQHSSIQTNGAMLNIRLLRVTCMAPFLQTTLR